MNRQFYHGTKDKGHSTEFTLAMEVPTKENLRIDIWKLLGENIEAVKYSIGVSKVSTKDRYNKKMGRELTVSRMEEVEVKLVDIIVTGDTKTVLFRNEYISLLLEMKNGRDKVHLIEVAV